jgi:hypothetical protein
MLLKTNKMSCFVYHRNHGFQNPVEIQFSDNTTVGNVQNEVREFLNGVVFGTLRIRKADESSGAIVTYLEKDQAYNFFDYDFPISKGKSYTLVFNL